MSEPQMMAACPAFITDACGGCPCIKIHEKNSRCEKSNIDCPACTPLPAAEQPPRKTARERIGKESYNHKANGEKCCLECAERVITAADAKEDALREELAAWKDAALERKENAERFRAQLAAANEERDGAIERSRVDHAKKLALENDNAELWREREDAKARIDELGRERDALRDLVADLNKELKGADAERLERDTLRERVQTLESVMAQDEDWEAEGYRARLANHYAAALTQVVGQEIADETQTRLIYRTSDEAMVEAERRMAAIDAHCAARKAARG